MKKSRTVHDGQYLHRAYQGIVDKLNIKYSRIYNMVKSLEESNNPEASARTVNSHVSNTMSGLKGPNLSWRAFISFLRALRIPKVDVTFTLHLRDGTKLDHSMTIDLDSTTRRTK